MHHIARLFVENSLSASALIELNSQQSHYVAKVMRLRLGGKLRLFNGQDGEWSASVHQLDKRKVQLQVQTLLRQQVSCPDIELVFAPVKRSRMEFIVEKATELGASSLQVVRTDHTSQKTVRFDRLNSIVIEAAEQTERLDIPQIFEEQALVDWRSGFPNDRVLVFCDESGTQTRPILSALRSVSCLPISVLIGPEGGFSKTERTALRALAGALPVSLGPRILRSDTAAVAALTLVQSVCGDWQA